MYDYTIWYSSELILADNGTFSFHDQGCQGQNFTKGRWTNDKERIILSSNETYRPVEEVTVVSTPVEHANRKYSYIDAPKIPGPDDTVLVFFDKVQLKLKGDTIYCIDSNIILADHRFSRAINNH